MNKHQVVITSAAFALLFGAVTAMADTTVNATYHVKNGLIVGDSHSIHIKDGDVVIDNDNGSEARITTNGQLIINGKAVSVPDQDKLKLAQYNSTVKDIEDRGIKLGMDAAGFAVDVVANVIGDLLSGEGEADIDKHASARAHQFKQKALPICQDVHTLKHIQDDLSADIQSFKPFTVIEGKDADDCEHDINSND